MPCAPTRSIQPPPPATRWAACLLAVLLLIAGSQPGYAGDNTWTPLGLYGVRVVDIAVDPHNSQVVYAATSGPGGVYKSTDGGLTWNSSLGGTWDWHERILIDPLDSNTVYVNAHGLYKSTNAGEEWQPLSLPLPNVSAAAISPLDGSLYLAAYSTGGEGDPAVRAILRSRDGGQTWDSLSAPSAGGLQTITLLSIAPSAPHILYAASDSDRGIFKSMDGGESWQPIDAAFALPPPVYALVVDPYDAQLVYLGTADSSIFRSSNGGQSWLPIGSGLAANCIRDIQIDPGNQQVIYSGGGTPNFFPSNPGTPGVYWSLDNTGSSWAALMDGMGSRSIMSLASDHQTPRTIYAGTDGSGVWKYTRVDGPPDYSVSINQGAVFTHQTGVTLALTAPAGTTQMLLSNDGGFSGAAWEPFAPSKAWTLTDYGQYVLPRIVYAKFNTNGKLSGVYQDDIVLDVTPPSGTLEISATSGGLPALQPRLPSAPADTHWLYLPFVARYDHRGFTRISLILSASDDLSGVGGMLIANDPAFSGAAWEAFDAGKDWWVPETGTTTVYARYRDRAGNLSAVYSAAFTP